jgi:hypothetical protein
MSRTAEQAEMLKAEAEGWSVLTSGALEKGVAC